jgi:thioredoxin-related protein
MKKLVRALVVLPIFLTACSSGSWVDLAAFGAPRNCKDLDGKTKGKELSGAEILLNANAKETLIFFARATCSNVGKAWTSDVRCGDTGVQVKCK